MMIKGLLATAALLIGAMSILAWGNPPEGIDYDWYKQNYDFMAIPDTFFTYEGEFTIPDGFHRPDSSQMTPFQYWISHFPIWHHGKSVGQEGGMRKFKYTEICRAVHLPWRSRLFTDYGIPLRILAEFLRFQHREYDLKVMPKRGKLLTYEQWLKGKPVYNNVREVYFQPSEQREPSAAEYYAFLALCQENSNYKSLAENCDSLAAPDLAPGDLYIGHDESGKTGFVYVLMNMFINDQGMKIYTFATGCPYACDFYMPLVNEDRNNPWLTLEQIKSMAPVAEHTGFYRMRVE